MLEYLAALAVETEDFNSDIPPGTRMPCRKSVTRSGGVGAECVSVFARLFESIN